MSLTSEVKRSVVAQRRALIVFALALLVLGLLAGKRAFAPSANNHFVHMADGWLEGRTQLPGKPPGWCASKDEHGRCVHRYDDYAVLWTLERRDGTGDPVRAYPCETKACHEARRKDGTQRWYVVGRGWVEFERNEVRKLEDGDTWFVTFPPGPAVAMLPFVAVFGLGTWDAALTLLAGALIPALLVAFFDRQRGLQDGRGAAHLWVAAAFTFASPACWLAANGQVWFTAQIFAALFLVLYLMAAWEAKYPLLAGLCLGLAVACRPINALPAVVLFAVQWWRNGRPVGSALRFGVALGTCGLALAAFNYLRFEDPLEFGHRFLQIRWQARMQEVGMFSLDYLERNLRCLLTLLPVSDPRFPWFKVSIHGSALWVGAPWLAAIVFARRKFPQRLTLWSIVLLSALPTLLYQNSGQIQYSYRFAVDWLPWVVVALTMGGAMDPRGRGYKDPRAWWLPALIVAGAAFHAWGAYNFERAKGRIFVTNPPGWPFGDELADD